MSSSPPASAPPPAQGRGGFDVDTLADDHDPVALARGLDRDVVVQHVLQHRPRVALERIAVAAGARLPEGYDIAVGELARLLAVDALLARARAGHRRGEQRVPSEQSRELARSEEHTAELQSQFHLVVRRVRENKHTTVR